MRAWIWISDAYYLGTYRAGQWGFRPAKIVVDCPFPKIKAQQSKSMKTNKLQKHTIGTFKMNSCTQASRLNTLLVCQRIHNTRVSKHV